MLPKWLQYHWQKNTRRTPGILLTTLFCNSQVNSTDHRSPITHLPLHFGNLSNTSITSFTCFRLV
ncbi:MAG TPA: hypothetical protein VK517_07885, partial [Cyclobacteriaceae bacterium]|nr:hypothetical protein [Cyclobacteriaceae bacterium]